MNKKKADEPKKRVKKVEKIKSPKSQKKVEKIKSPKSQKKVEKVKSSKSQKKVEKVKTPKKRIYPKIGVVKDECKNKMGLVMKEFKDKKLKSRYGKLITNYKQAVAIGLSSLRKCNES